MDPVRQEAERGHKIMWLGGDLYLEVSAFHGKTYAAIRRWFKADDGRWYRTKNGLHMTAEDLRAFLSYVRDTPDVDVFMADEIASPWEDGE
jgi:Transcriptional Coactivator p15 (PC4).